MNATSCWLMVYWRIAIFTEPPIFTKTYDLIKWINDETTKFPKSQRFILAHHIQNESLELLKCFICIRRGLDSGTNFKKADVHLETLRILIRLAYESNFLNIKKYEWVIKMLEEIGRLLGDWQKRKESKQ